MWNIREVGFFGEKKVRMVDKCTGKRVKLIFLFL